MGHIHTRDCYDDPGPAHGRPFPICGQTDQEKPCFHIGDIVNYSSVIGGPPTQFNLTVKTDPILLGGHTWVVWLEGKSGCVATAACTLVRRG